MLEPGSIIQNRYRIVKPLGEGGMGAVYRAWDLRLNVPVALKEMRPQPGLDDELLQGLRQQFQQEASVLARLNHPNLVRVTDYFEEMDEVFLVMDFVSGENLANVINKSGAQTEQQVMGWAKQLLEALSYCHSQGVIHRDIKPQNIILKDAGNITLVDFGLVKLWDPNDPRTKTVMRGLGTPEYAPPEQYGASADHTGPPSDLYSLGATLYHALTGKAPPTATERMAIPDQFIPLHQLAPNVSSRTEAVVMKALELSVPKRWRSASEMQNALLGSGPMPGAETNLPSPFAEPTDSVAYERTQQVQSNIPIMADSVPRQSTTFPTATPQVQERKKWPVALGVVGGILCIVASCIGAIIGIPTIQEMLAPTSLAPTFTPTTQILQQPTNTPTATPQVSLTGFALTVDNQSPYDVCYIYISPVDNDSWGDDWLDSEQVISPDEVVTFEVSPGEYDFLAETCDEATLATGWRLSSDVTYQIGGSGLVPVWVYNTLDVEICYLFISPVLSEDWGLDWLGEIESIPPEGIRVVFVSPDVYDFSAMNCDDEEVGYQYDITVESETEWYIE